MASNYNRKSNSSASRKSSKSTSSKGSSTRSSSRQSSRSGIGKASARKKTTSRQAQPSEKITSVRVGDLNKNKIGRTRRVQKSYQRYVSRVLAVVAVLVVLVVAGFFLYNSDLFPVTKVTVTGVEHLTADEMTELASVPQGTTLLRVDANGIKNRLLNEPWVKDASVNRVFPDTIELAITERSISAVIDVPVNNAQSTDEWAIASDGMWLMHIPALDSEKAKTTSTKVYEDAAQAIHITGVPYGISPKVGENCSDENVNNALAIVSGMTTDLANQIKSVTATGTETTTLILDNGVEIAFGAAKDIREKERVCIKLMEENPEKIAYINVRVVDKPTWRAAE